MEKFYEIPELNVVRFNMHEPVTTENVLSIGDGFTGDEGVEEW